MVVTPSADIRHPGAGFHHRDHLGSTRAVLSHHTTPNIVETYDYMPFGEYMSGRITISGTGTRPKFTGHAFDDETALYDMHWRRYNPRYGQFRTPDPMGDMYPGINPYVYVLNDPLRLVDPDGRFSTHVDSTGTVIGVYDDGDTNVYRHDDLGRNDGAQVSARRAEGGSTHGGGDRIGFTLHTRSFREGDQIDLIGTDTGSQLIDYFELLASRMGLLRYAANAVDGGSMDVKSQTRIGGYVRGGNGLLVSSRDIGNITAGRVARSHPLLTNTILATYGEFNIPRPYSPSRKADAAIAVALGISTWVMPQPQRTAIHLWMFSKEDPVTVAAILYGIYSK